VAKRLLTSLGLYAFKNCVKRLMLDIFSFNCTDGECESAIKSS